MPKVSPVSRDLVQAMFMAGLKTHVICAQTGLNPQTLKTWSNRYGWTKEVAKVRNEIETRYRGIVSHSLGFREAFATDLVESAKTLAKVPHKANYKAIRARAECLEPLARTAKLVFDWGNDKPAGLIDLDAMKQANAIEMEPVPVPDPTPEQEQAMPQPLPDAEPKHQQ